MSFFFPQNGNDIMAILMTFSEAQVANKEAEIAEVEKARQTAELLSAREDGWFLFVFVLKSLQICHIKIFPFLCIGQWKERSRVRELQFSCY